MKKLIPFCLVLLLALTGCVIPASKQQQYNNAGTQAVAEAPPAQAPSSSAPEEVPEPENTANHAVLDTPQDGDIIYIRENLFIAQTNDIYLNYPDYLGRTVEYEGFMGLTEWEESSLTYHFVVRNGPGCCGFDDLAGFEVYYPDETMEYPEPDAWVRVKGVLELYDEDGGAYLTIRILELEELEERGAEYVAN